MVLCFKATDCDSDAYEEAPVKMKSLKCSEHCACVKIAGRDHLKTKRARKFRCRSKRIKRLALPKYYTPKYCEVEPEMSTGSVEIVRTYKEQTPVRIRMLAHPKIHHLVASRDAYKGMIDKEWHGRFENLIHRSMLTMYSRLANVQLPDKPQRKKWTRADWQRHCEWLKSRAVPKIPTVSPPIKSKKVPIEKLMKSVYELSRPRHPRKKYRRHYGYVSHVKDATKFYEPTPRIMQLAVPKLKAGEDPTEDDSFHVKPSALKFNPSKFWSSS
jgi:hypothetical protein